MEKPTKKTPETEFEAMKPRFTLQQAMEEMGKTLNKVPMFSAPAVSSLESYMPVIPRVPTQEEVNEYQSASVLMQALAEEALRWKDQLPDGYRPAILAVLYGGIQMHVHLLAQVSFHGIRIEGTMNGAPCSLLAHQSTVQLLCYAEKIEADTQRNPIGFLWSDKRIEV